MFGWCLVNGISWVRLRRQQRPSTQHPGYAGDVAFVVVSPSIHVFRGQLISGGIRLSLEHRHCAVAGAGDVDVAGEGVDRHPVQTVADGDGSGDGVGGGVDHRHRVAARVGDVDVAGDGAERQPVQTVADGDR